LFLKHLYLGIVELVSRLHILDFADELLG